MRKLCFIMCIVVRIYQSLLQVLSVSLVRSHILQQYDYLRCDIIALEEGLKKFIRWCAYREGTSFKPGAYKLQPFKSIWYSWKTAILRCVFNLNYWMGILSVPHLLELVSLNTHLETVTIRSYVSILILIITAILAVYKRCFILLIWLWQVFSSN